MNFGGAASYAELERVVIEHVVAREGGRQGCAACGLGPVLRRELIESVHPVSGDAYGVIETTCLSCRRVERHPFADH